MGVLIVNRNRGKAKLPAADSGNPPPIAALEGPGRAAKSTPIENNPTPPPVPAPPPTPAASQASLLETTVEPVLLAMGEQPGENAPAPASDPSLKDAPKNSEAANPPAPTPVPPPESSETPKPADNNLPAPAPTPMKPAPSEPIKINDLPPPLPDAAAPANPNPSPKPPDSSPKVMSPSPKSDGDNAPAAPSFPLAAPEPTPIVAPAETKQAEPRTLPNASVPAAAVVAGAAAVVTANSATLPNFTPAPSPAHEPVTGNAAPGSQAVDTSTESWKPLPNVGKKRIVLDDDPLALSPDLAPNAVREPPTPVAPRALRGKLAQARKERVGIEPVPHVVERGESFYTISQLYYGYGRFWKALWAANREAVPDPRVLYVGQTIRIPSPEDLDSRLIEPARSRGDLSLSHPSPTSGSLRKATRMGSGAAKAGNELDLPTNDPFSRRRPLDVEPDPEAVAEERANRPQYKVRPHETLRSIARDTLGDSRRADEILELNDKVIDDPAQLVTGQILKLPEDAKIGANAGRQTR